MISPKILIVEDDHLVATDLQKRLIILGYDIIDIVTTGEEAIKKAILSSPDLVLMNVLLKGEMDGIETASTLRFQHGFAVVFLSALADSETMKRASKTEPFGYILKPFEERELHATIEMALNRRDLEKKFKENETWYGTTLRSIGEAVISTNTHGAIQFMNTAAENLTGWKMNEVLGKDLMKVFHTIEQSLKPHGANPVDQILRNKITAVLKNHATLISREGKEIPIEESASPIKDALGTIVGVVLVFKDVSDRKRAQEALKTSQEYAQSIIESSMDMVIAVDLDRHIIEFNKAAEKTFGYTKEEIVGKHIDMLYAEPEAGRRVNRKVSELGREVTEIWNRRKNGEIFPCLLSSSVLLNSRGDKIGYMGMSRDISEIAKTDEQLKAAQEYAQSIIHSSLDMIIAVDKNLDIIEFNKAAEETYGYTAKELVGKHISILYADPEESAQVYTTTVERNRYVQEVLCKRKNGESFHSLLSSSVLRDTKGDMIGVMGVSRDITEKYRTDQALRESEERYRTLIELSPDPVAVHMNDRLVFVNPAAVQMFAAKSSDELIGKSIMDLVHPEYRIIVRDRILQMSKRGKRVPTIEEKFNRLDGTSFEAEVAAMPFLWKGKSAVQVVLRDVTDRRKAEQAIRGSEAKYRSLVENVLDGVYQTSPEGEILTANPALARILGYSSETDLLLLNVEKELYVDAEERKKIITLLHKEGSIKNAEYKLRRKDGQIIDVLENARVVRSRSGDILYYEGTITDITELKNAQNALRISEERFRAFVEQSNEAIWCFESPEPMPLHLSEERQIKFLMEKSCLTECNNTMARMYSLESADQLLGAMMKNLLDPSDPANIEFLRSFIRSNYRLVNATSHEVDKNGESKYFLNTMIGIIEGEKLVRVWGTQRDITVEKLTEMKNDIHREQVLSSLTKNEQRYKEYFDMNTIGHFIAHPDGMIMDCTPALIHLLGFSSHHELLTARVNILGSSKTIRKSLLKRLMKSHHVLNYKVKLTGSAAKTITVLAHYITTLDQKEELVLIKGTIAPIGRSRGKR